MPQHDPSFWSSCHAAPAEYAGYYRCGTCKARLRPQPYLRGDAEAAAARGDNGPWLLSVRPAPRHVQPYLEAQEAGGEVNRK